MSKVRLTRWSHSSQTFKTVKNFRLEEEELEKASPQKSGKKKPSSRNRTLSTESIGSTVSDSDDEARPKPKKEESIFDEFEMEERPAVSQTEECVKETHDNNREADKVLSSFFAGKQHDKLPTVRKPPVPSAATSTPENKRFTKPSQREMKRLLSMGHSTKQINDKEASPEGAALWPVVNKGCHWYNNGSYLLTFFLIVN